MAAERHVRLFKNGRNAVEVLPLDEDADGKYAELRTALERAGTPIGANDYLIAAHALSLELTRITDTIGGKLAGALTAGGRLGFENRVTVLSNSIASSRHEFGLSSRHEKR